MRKHSPNPPSVTIKLDSKNFRGVSFVDFNRWAQGFFDLGKYDSVRLKSSRSALSPRCPDASLTKAHELGSKTRVTTLYDPLVLIPPNEPIALRHDPEAFTLIEREGH